ncbi:hypothetical protein ACHMW6_31805 [Pseudoduganella sp. UC29_106]|uniref:hypothetical protein n=1 Tax=Pseudoduganella sp. UC29_106 TaxID=3374553 RepID=UPI003756F8FE
MAAGYSLHLTNTTAIKQYDRLKHRGDECDARHLAHILRLGLLPEGHIMLQPIRAVRDLARERMQLVQQRTTQLVAIQTCLMQQTGEAVAANDIKRLTCSFVDALALEPDTVLGIKANLFVLQALQTRSTSLKTSWQRIAMATQNINCSPAWQALAPSSLRSFFLRPARSSALLTPATTHRTADV